MHLHKERIMNSRHTLPRHALCLSSHFPSLSQFLSDSHQSHGDSHPSLSQFPSVITLPAQALTWWALRGSPTQSISLSHHPSPEVSVWDQLTIVYFQTFFVVSPPWWSCLQLQLAWGRHGFDSPSALYFFILVEVTTFFFSPTLLASLIVWLTETRRNSFFKKRHNNHEIFWFD